MFGIFVDICKEIITQIKDNNRETKENRLRVAQILDDISHLLHDTAEKLSNDVYPHANCAIMEELSYQLKSNLITYIDEERSNKLEEVLKEVILIEKQFAKRKDPETIPSIEGASGQFKAMSLLLRF